MARKLDSQPYDIDNLDNGVVLTKTGYSKIEGISEGLPFHSGSHPIYNDLASEIADNQLKELYVKYDVNALDDLMKYPEAVLEATKKTQAILFKRMLKITGELH